MTWYYRLRQALGRLASTPVDELAGAQRTLRYVIDLVRHCTQQLHKDRAAQMAAALTYHTLFSILPTIVLVLIVLHSFVGDDHRRQFKEESVNWLLKWLHEENAPADPAPMTLLQEQGMPGDPAAAPEHIEADQLAAAVQKAKQEDLENIRRNISVFIQEQINKLETVNFASIGVIGVLVFIYGATSLLATVERSFNTIFGISRARPWYMRLPLYYTIITLSPLVLLAGQYIQGQFLEMLSGGVGAGWFVTMVTGLSPLITTWVVLGLMYVLIPNTSVKVRTAAIGSFVAAVLWVTVIELLTMYMGRASTSTFYGALYGALALLPLMLLWIWLTWLIILFGLELSFTLQTLRGRQVLEEQTHMQQNLPGDPLWLVPIMTQIAQAFAQGKTASIDDVARQLNLPMRCVADFGSRLEEEGLIHRVADDGRQEAALTLALPPDRIAVGRLLEVGRKITMSCQVQSGNPTPASELLDRLVHYQAEAAADTTLESLIQD